MKTNNRLKEEYGGFLPLELNSGREWFEQYEDRLLRFNSVKASLAYVLKRLQPDKVYIPYYYCPSTTEAVSNFVQNVCFYHIKEDLLPDELPDEAGTVIILVNYFGILNLDIGQFAESYRKAKVIIDNAHSFYCEPIMTEGIINIYSAKKFFGIPDGSYVVGKQIEKTEQPDSYSTAYAPYLLTTYEHGTNIAYQSKKEADAYLQEHYGTMSKLSRGLLQNVNYELVKRKREENFKILNETLGYINAISINENFPAYHYPLLFCPGGNKIKQALIREKVYVPTLWDGEALRLNGNSFEHNMSENAIFLPIDQRYDVADMKFIIERVRYFFDEYSGYNG